jgi:hypothetical protein
LIIATLSAGTAEKREYFREIFPQIFTNISKWGKKRILR